MPPISSSRLAPRTICNSPAASIWAIQVRKSCLSEFLGALLSALVDVSAGRFMGWAFRSGGAFERTARHRAAEIAPILGAGVVVLERIDGGGGGIAGGAKHLRPRTLTVERRLGLGDPARPRFGAADAHTRVRNHAVLQPVAHGRHAER